MTSDEQIDNILLKHIGIKWRKVAYVVGMTMMELGSTCGVYRSDTYFADRIAQMVAKGRLEYMGDMNNMRDCEVKIKL